MSRPAQRIETLAEGRVTLYPDDCLEALPTLDRDLLDGCITDPPYGLGFMGKAWDHGVPGMPYWKAVYRVLKPGAHLLAFGGTRTYHRMACAIEDAGFEIRDSVLYLYGSGFPKNLNVGKSAGDAICSCEALSERDLRSLRDADVSSAINSGDECGQVLFTGMSEHGASATRRTKLSNFEGRKEPGLEGWGDISQASRQLREREVCPLSSRTDFNGAGGRLRDGASASDGEVDRAAADPSGVCPPRGPSTAEQRTDESGTLALQSQPQKRGAWDHCGRCGKPILPEGLGTALKPACEPIVLARKPLSESTVAANVLKWGTGALNIDGCRVDVDRDEPNRRNNASADESPESGWGMRGQNTRAPTLQNGRWPANVIHDGSDEVVGAFPDTDARNGGVTNGERASGGWGMAAASTPIYRDSGCAARFFYSAKADSDDRLGSKHPTVKPIDVNQYLCRLIGRKGALIIDPFAGTGTTGEACIREGMRAILIEKEAEYQEDIRRRMKLAMAGPFERALESARARHGDKPFEAGTLFGAS